MDFTDSEFNISKTAAALLFTTNTDSEPVNDFNRESTWKFLSPLFPENKSNSKLEYPDVAFNTSVNNSFDNGDLPNPVCNIIPVPFITG